MTLCESQRYAVRLGDSREIIRKVPDNFVDFILTDPPYNLARHSTGNIPLPNRTPMNNDVARWDLEIFKPAEWADEFIRILKPTGNLFIFTSYNMIRQGYSFMVLFANNFVIVPPEEVVEQIENVFEVRAGDA